jgi:UDP-N-acetylglucosamine 2-epimerase (non-hydrolysing)
MKPIALFIGTRPEAIKLTPVIEELKKRAVPHIVYCVQQQSMAAKYLIEKDISAAFVSLNRSDGSLTELIAETTKALQFLAWKDFSYAVVQGDTTTAMCAALVAAMNQVPVAHIEAGLRSHAREPFPEEINRRLISEIAAIHFAPTTIAGFNLEKENFQGKLAIVGNTGIDALHNALASLFSDDVSRIVAACCDNDPRDRDLVLLTCHRRENWNHIDDLIDGLQTLPDDCYVVWPCHPNPLIRDKVQKLNRPNVAVVDPLSHTDTCHLLSRAAVVVTDSGGMIEEACEESKPCLILREVTERPEALDDGCKLYPPFRWKSIGCMIGEARSWKRSSKGRFGDGLSAHKIVDVLAIGSKLA